MHLQVQQQPVKCQLQGRDLQGLEYFEIVTDSTRAPTIPNCSRKRNHLSRSNKVRFRLNGTTYVNMLLFQYSPEHKLARSMVHSSNRSIHTIAVSLGGPSDPRHSHGRAAT